MKHLHAVGLLLLILFSGEMFAQKRNFHIVTFEEEPFFTGAKEYQKVDGNGDRYSIVRVSSTNPDDNLRDYRFEFGRLAHEVIMGMKDDGALWIYVQRNAKKVTITRDGFNPIEYNLPITIQEGKFYVMQLSVEAKEKYEQTVQFQIKPISSGATIMVKSIESNAKEVVFGTVSSEGIAENRLALGTYTYRVSSDLYIESTGGFTLKEQNGKHEEKITLTPNYSEVTLSVDSDADIYVNGNKKGRRTWTGPLKADMYYIECKQENHHTTKTNIIVTANNNCTYTLEKPTPINGTLFVTSVPTDAKILIDGKNFGETPQLITTIIGKHKVELSKENYRNETREVEITDTETNELQVTMNNGGDMSITSMPSCASLYVNGEYVGETPYEAEMNSGDYDIKIMCHKYKIFNERVHLDVAHPENHYVLQRQYQLKTCFYIEPAFQVGSLMGVGGMIGAYVSNVNIEAGYLMGLSSGEEVYWNYHSTLEDKSPIRCAYKPTVYSGRAGYGFVLGTRLRLTPQLGASLVSIESEASDSKCYAVTGTLGVRANFALMSAVAVYATPELSFPVQKSEVFTQISEVSSAIKKWGSGFNLRVGLTIML